MLEATREHSKVTRHMLLRQIEAGVIIIPIQEVNRGNTKLQEPILRRQGPILRRQDRILLLRELPRPQEVTARRLHVHPVKAEAVPIEIEAGK